MLLPARAVQALNLDVKVPPRLVDRGEREEGGLSAVKPCSPLPDDLTWVRVVACRDHPLEELRRDAAGERLLPCRQDGHRALPASGLDLLTADVAVTASVPVGSVDAALDKRKVGNGDRPGGARGAGHLLRGRPGARGRRGRVFGGEVDNNRSFCVCSAGCFW